MLLHSRAIRSLGCLLLVTFGIWSAACRSARPPLAANEVSGQVVNPEGTPIAGVRVTAQGKTVTTNRRGEFRLVGPRVAPRLAVSFSAPGFVRTTRVFPVAIRGNTVVIWPRAKQVIVDAAAGGRVPFANGGSVTLPQNALVDEKGRALAGPVGVSVTYLDVSDPAQLRVVPGDFTAKMRDGSRRQLESYGVFEIYVADGRGRRAELARGRTADVRIPVPRSFLGRAPAQISSFSFDTASGLWIEESPLVLDGPAYTGTISQFDWSWNADDPLDTTCMIFESALENALGPPTPFPNCFVEAQGVSYGSISSGYTDSNALVCLLVKVNSQVSVEVNGCVGHPNYSSYQPVILTSPSTPATCGDPTCPKYQIPFSIIVGDG